jgi:hypothetical protein
MHRLYLYVSKSRSRRGAENLAPSVIWSSDRPVRSESLYRLSYPGQYTVNRYEQHIPSTLVLRVVLCIINGRELRSMVRYIAHTTPTQTVCNCPDAGNRDAYTALLKVSFSCFRCHKARDLSKTKSVSCFPISSGMYNFVSLCWLHSTRSVTPYVNKAV